MVKSKKDYVIKLYDTPLISFSTEQSTLGTRTTKIKEVNEGCRNLFPLALLHDMNGKRLESWLKRWHWLRIPGIQVNRDIS